MKKFLSLSVLLISFSIMTQATVRNVPATYSTVSAALSACVMGDTVLVQPGTYIENITWPSIAKIKLLSAGDSTNTILSANNSGQVMQFNSSAIDTNTIIRGFTISDGYLNTSFCTGAGVSISGCSPKFESVAIKNNHCYTLNWNYGVGVYCSGSDAVFRKSNITANVADTAGWGYGGGVHLTGGGSPKFFDCKISNNIVKSGSWNYGVGVYCDGANPVFYNVIVSGNISGDGAIWYYGTGMYLSGNATLTNVLVVSNIMGVSSYTYYYGGGISCNSTNSNINLMNVTIADNKKSNGATINGSGLFNENSIVNITNSILWDNNSGQEASNNSGTLSITYSDVRNGFLGIGNINFDPLFVSANNFHLTINSPCTNAGTSSGAPSRDLENNSRPLPAATNPDMGCYEIDQSLIPPVIATDAITPTDYCQGQNVDVPFTVTGTISAGNIFTAELSDSTGNFISPVSIGTLNGISSGTINGTISLSQTAASGYRIRVVASLPPTNGSDNGNDLTINEIPVVILSPFSPDTLCKTDSPVTLSGGSPAGGTFSGQGVTGNTFSPDSVSVGTYTIYYIFTNAGGCSDSASQLITVEVCGGISENISQSEWNVYRISENKIFVEMQSEKAEEYHLSIGNTVGQILFSKDLNPFVGKKSFEISTEIFSSGIYFVRIESNSFRETKKILIE